MQVDDNRKFHTEKDKGQNCRSLELGWVSLKRSFRCMTIGKFTQKKLMIRIADTLNLVGCLKLYNVGR